MTDTTVKIKMENLVTNRNARRVQLKKMDKVKAEVSKVTEESVISAFRDNKDHMLKAAKILEAEENTKNLGDPSA